MGVCSITQSKLRVAVEGLDLVCQLGFHRVVLQLDFRCLVSLLTTVTNDDHQHVSLVARFKELQARN
ncbi:hypothetical protein LINGRAPRIM_LOCUS927 [Linum grandiflorum]